VVVEFVRCVRVPDRKFLEMDDLSNSMGLFLQKTNIIRDYLEDINEKRIFWPREVW
jgi:farnesyl-diphosphate farnesyltransferase